MKKKNDAPAEEVIECPWCFSITPIKQGSAEQECTVCQRQFTEEDLIEQAVINQ